MNARQKIVVAATVALAVIAAVYEWLRASEMERELQALREQQVSSTGQFEQLRREREEMSKRLVTLTDESAALKDEAAQWSHFREELAQSNSAAQAEATQSVAKEWLDRVTQLKQRMEQTLNAKIPELQLLTEEDWLNAAKDNLECDQDYRRALGALRDAAIGKFVAAAQPALKHYLADNNGQFPTALSQLKPYFESPVDQAILDRYEIITSESYPYQQFQGEWIIVLKAPVDEPFDARWAFDATQSTAVHVTPN
jgi:hypothetical protein